MFGRKAKAENARLKAQLIMLMRAHDALIIASSEQLAAHMELRRQFDETRAAINSKISASDATAATHKADFFTATGDWKKPESKPSPITVEILGSGGGIPHDTKVINLADRRGK